MRLLPLFLLSLVACVDPELPPAKELPGDDPGSAFVDPAIDAACTNMCDALEACDGVANPKCKSACAAVLTGCTREEVQAYDACSTRACGDLLPSEISTCMQSIACVDESGQSGSI